MHLKQVEKLSLNLNFNKNQKLFFIQINETCNLLDNFGLIIQFLMFWVIFGILICKIFFKIK